MKQVFKSLLFTLLMGSVFNFSAKAGEEIKTVKISSPDKKSFLNADKEMIANINKDILEWSMVKISVVQDPSADKDMHQSFSL